MERRYWRVVAILVLYCFLVALVCYVDVLPENLMIFEDKHARLRRGLPTKADRDLVLRWHNHFRSTISDEGEEPVPANMRYMTWDEGLAIRSLEYARMCAWGHSQPSFRNTEHFQNHDGINNGENLWTASGKLADEFDPKDAITIWFNEYKDYDFYTQVCDPGKKCGHYTQANWALSYKLGCAWHRCPVMKHFEHLRNPMYFVCMYAPGGNVAGRFVYEVGERCSKCDANDTCDDGKLCYSAERDKELVLSNEGLTAASLSLTTLLLSAAGFSMYVWYTVHGKLPFNLPKILRKKSRRISSAVDLKAADGSTTNGTNGESLLNENGKAGNKDGKQAKTNPKKPA